MQPSIKKAIRDLCKLQSTAVLRELLNGNLPHISIKFIRAIITYRFANAWVGLLTQACTKQGLFVLRLLKHRVVEEMEKESIRSMPFISEN